jgi:hypothetical protein
VNSSKLSSWWPCEPSSSAWSAALEVEVLKLLAEPEVTIIAGTA